MKFLALLGFFALCCVLSLGDKVRGVQDQHIDRYSLHDNFACLDGKSRIPASFVNDDFCDCDDGSDEPGTAACTFKAIHPPNWKFQCAERGITMEILHSRVLDGFCDCCDGSDEYDGRTLCPNTCAEMVKRLEMERKEQEERRAAGLKAMADMLLKSQQKKEEMEVKVRGAEEAVATLEEELKVATDEKDKFEEQERQQREIIKAKSEEEFEKWKSEKTKKEEETPVEPQPGQIVCVGWRQTKDCVGNGERDADFDKDCKEHIVPDWSGYCECIDESGNEVKHEKDCDHSVLQCSYVCEHGGKDGLTPPPPPDDEFKVDDGSSFELEDAKKAREKIIEITSKKAEQQKIIDDSAKYKEINFGQDNVLLALLDECYEHDDNREYKYKLCPFKDVLQVKRVGFGSTSLGVFKGWGEQTYSSWGSKQDLSHMLFDNGERCWGGPARNTDVHFICGRESKLISVEEPSMCTYKMVFQTPGVCE